MITRRLSREITWVMQRLAQLLTPLPQRAMAMRCPWRLSQ